MRTAGRLPVRCPMPHARAQARAHAAVGPPPDHAAVRSLLTQCRV